MTRTVTHGRWPMQPLPIRVMTLRYMSRMALAFHMSLHTFLFGVLLLDELHHVPVFQCWNDQYFRASVALMLAFERDDGHHVILAPSFGLHYSKAGSDELFRATETFVLQWTPQPLPQPGIMRQYWTSMHAALHQRLAAEGAPLLEAEQVPLYRRTVASFPVERHTQLFQLLWVMPLVPLGWTQQERLVRQLMAGEHPPAAAYLQQLERQTYGGPRYPDFAMLEHFFPQVVPRPAGTRSKTKRTDAACTDEDHEQGNVVRGQ